MTSQKTELARLFREIDHKLKHSIRRCFEENGMTMPQGMVIGMLHKHGEMKISEISANMGLSNSTVSGIIDRLEKQKFVERRRGEKDRRIVYVKLAPNFPEVDKDIHKLAEEQFALLIDKGTPEEIDKIVEGLKILKRILDKNKDKIENQ